MPNHTRRTTVLTSLAALVASGLAIGAVSAGSAGAAPRHVDLKALGARPGQVSQPAQASSTSTSLSAVSVAPHSTETWAYGLKYTSTGSSYFVLRGKGHSFKKLALPAKDSNYYTSIAAGSSKSAWVVGADSSGPLVLHSKGKKFKAVKVKSTATQWRLVAASSTSNAWLVGYDDENNPVLSRLKGKKWKTEHVPAKLGVTTVSAVSTSSAKNAWFLGNDSAGPVAMHWNGHTFATTSLVKYANDNPTSIATTGAKKVWLSGYTAKTTGMTTSYLGETLRGNGKKFKLFALPKVHGDAFPQQITMAGSAAYLAGYSQTASTKGLDYQSFAMRYSGGHWKKLHVAIAGKTSQLTGISASSKSVVTVGESYNGLLCSGKVVTSKTYLATLSGSSFHTAAAPSYLPDVRAC